MNTLPFKVRRLAKEYAQMKIIWFEMATGDQKLELRHEMAKKRNDMYYYQAILNFPVQALESYIKEVIDSKGDFDPELHTHK